MRSSPGCARCGVGAVTPAQRGAARPHAPPRAPLAPCAALGGGSGGPGGPSGGSGGSGGGDAPQPGRRLGAAALCLAASLVAASHARAADDAPATAAPSASTTPASGGLSSWRAAAKALSSSSSAASAAAAGGGADEGDGDVARLRRLQRDAFRELLEAKRRIRTLEELTGADNAAAAAIARVAKLSGVAPANAAPGLRLSGRLSAAAGGAALGGTADGQDALRRAGLVSASLLELSVEAPLRLPSAPQLSATAAVVPSGVLDSSLGGAPALRLTRLCVALRSRGGRLRLRLLARGGGGADAAACLTPTAGRAATALARGGAAPYRRCSGSGAAAQADVDTPAGGLTLSLAAFASPPPAHIGDIDAPSFADDDVDGSDGGPTRDDALTLFAAATLRPAPRVAFALAAATSRRMRRHAPGGGFIASLGAFCALPHATSPLPPPQAEESSSSSSSEPGASGRLEASSTVVSASAAAVLRDTLTLSAWAAAEVSGAASVSAVHEWGAALAPAPHATGLRWGLAAGRALRGGAVAEAFLHCGGGGWTLTPALVALPGRGAAAVVRAHTTF